METEGEPEVKVPAEDELQVTYHKSYLMQVVGPDGNSVRTTVPKQVVEKEATRLGLKVEEFIERYKIKWLYNGFPGLYGLFVLIEKEPNEPKKSE